jgi:outer membrane biosynthesis protein TonB
MTELFANFEVNRAPLWRRLTRLTIFSVVMHALFFAAALYIPVLREAFHLVDKASGAEYVDEEYARTDIRDQAVMIDASEKLYYPQGYFDSPQTAAVAVPEPQIIEQPLPIPITTPTPTPIPSPTPTPEASPSPQAPVSTADAKDGEKIADGTKTEAEKEKELDELAAKSGIVRPQEGKINKRPLKDWLAKANELKVKGELDLSGTVEVIIVAQRDEKGKLHNPQVVRKTGDPILVEVAKELVAAINDSNVLYFLEGTGGGTVRFLVKLDAAQVTASVESEVESAERAKQMASGYGLLLMTGKLARSGKDEAVIYENTKIAARGNQIVVNFSMPRQTAGDMLKKQLPAG